MTLHLDPSLSNDAVLSNWLHLHRVQRRPMIMALEPIELAQYDASHPRDRDALVGAVSLALETLPESPEIVMRVDGPFFLAGFSILSAGHATDLVRTALQVCTAAVHTVTTRPVRPAIAVQFPTPVTTLYAITDQAVTELIEMRATVRADLVSS